MIRLFTPLVSYGSGNASGVKVFIDTIEETLNIETDTLNTSISNNVTFNIAAQGSDDPFTSMEVIIDELRISKTLTTLDRIKTEYNNQNNLNSFYTAEPEETNGVNNRIIGEDLT